MSFSDIFQISHKNLRRNGGIRNDALLVSNSNISWKERSRKDILRSYLNGLYLLMSAQELPRRILNRPTNMIPPGIVYYVIVYYVKSVL